jgi:hypothetical protein
VNLCELPTVDIVILLLVLSPVLGAAHALGAWLGRKVVRRFTTTEGRADA